MKRTQVQLDELTSRLLQTRAFERGISMAAFIRDVLHEHLKMKPTRAASLNQFRFIGSGRSCGSELEPLSERHDEVLAEDFI